MKSRMITGLFVLSTLLLTTTCRDLTLDSITDGLVLNVNFDVFRTPLIFNFTDATPGNPNPPANLNIRIEGADKNRVYTTDGRSELEAIDGILEVSVDRIDSITPANPLELTVIAEAPGYLKTVQNVVLYDTSFQFLPVNMVSLSNLPAGVSMARGGFMTDGSGSTSNSAFATPLSTGKVERASVTVRSGTQLRDDMGRNLTGTVDVQMVHFDNRSDESLNAFPGGMVANNVIGPNGERLDPLQFVTAGFIALDMFVGNDEVKTFSQPIEVSVGINPNTVNPETGLTVRIGDRIPIWSLDDETGTWTYEGETIIERNPLGQMEVNFDIDHLSWWNLDWFYGNRCTWRNPVTLRIDSDNEESTAPSAVVQLVDANTGARFGGTRRISLRNNSAMTLYNLPSDRDLRLQFLSTPSYFCRNVVYESAPFRSNCQSEVMIDTRGFQPTNRLLVQAAVSGICRSETADIKVTPSAWIFFREAECPYWRYLSYVWRGRFYSNQLELGKTYDFRVHYGGQRYNFNDVPMQSTTIIDENYQLNIELDQGTAFFNIQDIRIPDRYCDDLLGG